MAGGMRGLAGGLGSLGSAYEVGRQSRFAGEQNRSDLDTANLERILAQAKGQREAELHPLALEKGGLENAGLGLNNQQTAQTMGINANKEGRAQEEHVAKQQKEIIEQYGALSSELEALPEGVRMEYLNKRLGQTEAGRNQIRSFQAGMKEGHINAQNLPQVLKAINEHAIKRSAAYMQSMDGAKIKADAALERTNATLENRLELQGMKATLAAGNAAANTARAVELQNEKYRLREAEREKDLARQMALLKERQKGAEKIQELRNTAASGKGAKSPKTYQELSTALLQQSLALRETDPEAAAKLQEEANQAFEYAATLKASGTKQTDTVLTTGDDGKAGLGQQGRIPSAPGTAPKPKASGGASGGWEGFSIKKKE